jgi:cyclopropane-fatty-acyl-phospholipid synthase
MPNEDIKATVREKYGQIATGAATGCGGTTCCGDDSLDISMVGDAYDNVEGYVADADLSLGCGLPTEYANLQPGQTVLDLGSGAGLDAFVARRIVGETGQVLGVDMTPEMIARARDNAEKLGYDNVTFHQGDIEALPLDDATVDVVISNCVLNLVPDKQAAFAEMHRVLRPGGHFCVSDIVYEGELPEAVKRSAELYVGCVAGAMERSAYLDTLRAAGFANVRVVKEKVITIPEEALRPEENVALRASGSEAQSITVYGERV